LVTTLGGLISGLLVFGLAPEAEGHGTDAVVNAFHHQGGKLRLRVAPLKLIASAITIGSGGSAGREGPTALISACVGSTYGLLRKRTEHDRRLLLLIGAAAGLSAIFRSPIGSALFVIEVLYGDMEFEAGVLPYAMLSSIVAFAVNGLFVGYRPLFDVRGDLAAGGIVDHLSYVPLGVVAGLVGTIVPNAFYGMRGLFRRVPGPPCFKPAIGGLATGLCALALPQVLGGGYGWIQEAIYGRLASWLLLALLFGKLLAFCSTVSSGGSGGVFAPSLFVGAMLGAFLARLLHQPAAAFTVVGMAAVFGAAARVPIATLFMVTEMTGGYQLLVPAALAVFIAFLTQVIVSESFPFRSLYEAQVPHRGHSPAHQGEQLRLALDLLDRKVVPLPATTVSLELVALLRSGVLVSLADHRQLRLDIVSAESPLLDKTARAVERDGARIMAVVRRGKVMLPPTLTKVELGDELILIALPTTTRSPAEVAAVPNPLVS
jgi:CIC family chloride channel protein